MASQDIRVEITGTAEDLRRATNSAIRDIRNVAQETRRADAQMVVSNEATARSVQKLEDRQAGLAQASRNFGASWRAIGWSALVAEIGPATSAVSDLGVGMAGAAEAAAPLAGVVATLPNLIGAAGQAGIVAKLAFAGMDKALQGDQKALAALTPAAQKFVTTIRGEVGPVIRDLQKTAQAGLLPGVTKGVQDLVKDAPVIKTIIRDTADELGRLAEKAGAAASTPGFQKDLGQFGKTNVTVIHDLGDAALHLGQGFRQIVDAAQPLTRDLAHLASTISVDLEGAIVRARNSGDLKKFFDLTDTRVHQSVTVAKDFATVLLNIGKAAAPLGNDLAGGLVTGMDKLAHVTAGPGLKTFFHDAEEPLKQVGKLARDLAIDLGKLASSGQDPLSHLASTLRLDVLPTLSDLAQLLTTDVSPDLSKLIGDLGKLAHDALPGVHAAMPFVHDLADGLGAALKAADGLEKALPGITKLLVPLGIFAGVKAGKGLTGKLGGEVSAFGKSLRGATPANPLFVADVTGGGGKIPGVPGTVAKDAEKGKANTILEKAVRFAPLASATAVTAGGLGAVYGGGVLFDKLLGGAKGSDQRTQDFLKQTIKDSPSAADALSKVKDKLKELHAEEDQATRMGGDDRVTRDYDRQYAALNRFADTLRSAQTSTAADFAKMKAAAGSNLSSIRQTVASTTIDIARHLGTDTAQGKDAMIQNLELAATAVKTSMDQGVLSSRTGLAEIQKLFTDALKLYGFDAASAKNLAKNGVTVQQLGKVQAGSGGPGGGLGQTHGAAGGMVQIGRPGEGGRDTVPAMLNGQPAVIARGEVVSVFNRHQMAGLDAMASHAGYTGLKGFMASKPKNYMAAGGIVPAAAGGFFPAPGTDYSYGSEPQIAARLDRLGKALGLHLTGISGHRTPQHSVEVGGFADDPHTRGQASDTPGVEGVSEAILRKYGLTRPFAGAREADHIQLLGGKGGGAVGAAVQGAVDAIAQVNFPKGLGAVSAIGQASLDTIRAAANQKLSSIVGAAAPGGGGGGSALASVIAGASGSGRALMEHIAAARGWNFADWWALDASETSHGTNLANPTSTARLRGQFLSSNYGKYGPGSDPSQNPTMDQQIESMAAYIADRYGDPTKAWAFHQAHNWYSGGALIRAAVGTVSASGLGGAILGTANPPSNVPKPKKKKRAGRPFAGGPALPDVAKVKGRIGKKRKAKLPKWLKAFQGKVPEDLVGLIPDLEKLYESPIGDITQAITNLTGINELTEEQPTVTLYDSEQYADLTNYLLAHPDVLHGLSPGAWVEKNGDSLEVVNQDGMTVQGHYVRGIAQGVAEIDALLGLHGGPDRPKTLRGLLEGELAGAHGGQDNLVKEGFQVGSEIAQLRATWDADQELLKHNRARLGKLNEGPGSWQQRVADNDAKIKVLRGYLSNLKSAAIGHRLTQEAQHNRQKAEDKITALGEENTSLKRSKPAPKKGSKEATAHVRAQVAALHDEDSDLVATMNQISGGTDTWDPNPTSLAGTRTTRASSITEALKSFGDTLHRLIGTDIPQENLTIAGLVRDRNALAGTSIAPPALQRASPTAQDAEKASLLQQLLDTANRQHAIDAAQFATLRDFAPLADLRFQGAFLHGGRVPAEGLAHLHGGELVVPDPQGPFGSQITQAAAPSVEVHIHQDGLGGIKQVEALIDGRASRVVSQQLGNRTRLITAAPGGR